MIEPTPLTADVLRSLPLPRPSDGGKEERGRVLVVAGSVPVPGAAILAGTAALRAGAGKLQIATCRSIAPYIGVAVPEALVVGLPETETGGVSGTAADTIRKHADACDAVVVGPGMLDEPDLNRLLESLVTTAGPSLLFDAAAIPLIGSYPEALKHRAETAVVTPNAGEMARLLGVSREQVERQPVAAAREAATQWGVVAVMKGSVTHIVAPGGEVWRFDGGSVGLGTSGSGDVLAGLMVGLLARGATPLQASLWAVFLHGEAGRRLTEIEGEVGFLAREISAGVPRILSDLA